MCGRFTLTVDLSDLQQEYGLEIETIEWEPRFNIAPTQNVAVVTDSDSRKLQMMRWGLVPFWAKDINIGNQMINARSETAAEKPSFKYAFKQRRCLIPADGFYEWAKPAPGEKVKTPFYFQLSTRKPFMFAGLWEEWDKDKASEPLRTCTILTTTPNELVAPVHNRMPVILNPAGCWKWLEETNPEVLKEMLVPYPAQGMRAVEVSRHVNDPARDDPRCVEAVEKDE
jgi:putative SOS response-associated peptidase YedK